MTHSNNDVGTNATYLDDHTSGLMPKYNPNFTGRIKIAYHPEQNDSLAPVYTPNYITRDIFSYSVECSAESVNAAPLPKFGDIRRNVDIKPQLRVFRNRETAMMVVTEVDRLNMRYGYNVAMIIADRLRRFHGLPDFRYMLQPNMGQILNKVFRKTYGVNTDTFIREVSMYGVL